MLLYNSRVLVTGGAGFIGSNLVDALMAQDNHVVCLDNFFTGHRRNIGAHLGHPRFRLIEGDIRDLATCRCSRHPINSFALGLIPRSLLRLCDM